MSVIPITKNDVTTLTIVTTPSRTYTSSSTEGVTGSVKIYPRLSPIERDSDKSSYFNDTRGGAVVDVSFDEAMAKINNTARSKRAASLSVSSDAQALLNLVTASSHRETVVLDVERFTPTTRFTKYTLIKNNVKDVLMKHYRVDYPHACWAYTNYHALNFFTAFDGTTQLVPSSSVLLYPNVVDDDLPTQYGHVSGSYCLSGSFSFDFHVNPRYNEDGIDAGHFKDGTILHLSSSYALSLATGSLKDGDGLPLGFRVKLQLSHSADIPPSEATPGSYPHDLVFLSSDNSLTHNKWHHVVVRWGTDTTNGGSGSFVVDGDEAGTFVVPSGTVMPRAFSNSLNPDALCVGNFYEGQNYGVSAQSLFFNPDNSRRDGVHQITDEATEADNYFFRHPLKAELHDVTIRRYYMSTEEIQETGSRGLGNGALVKNDVAFYLPPFFVEEGPVLRWVGDAGGVLQTPFFEIDGSTDDPFNVAMSFGVNGHLINLENFVKDFSTGRFPRLMELTASSIDYTTDAQEANNFLYRDGGVAKRNLTVLPCDDGTFDPNYEILSSETHKNRFTDSFGNEDLSYINLEDLVTSASLYNGGIQSEAPDDYVEELYGPSPEFPGIEPGKSFLKYIASVTASIGEPTQDSSFDRGIQRGAPLTIYQRLQDPSSNQVTFFNISNMYYGRRIKPGSFEIKDSAISGSHGAVCMTLRDDGLGNLYRADSDTEHATQNSVGNIFYDEGVVVVKSPHLYFFGKNQYEMSFEGVYNVFSTKYEILAEPGLLNSSSNSSYIQNYASIRPSGNIKDTEDFVYISGIYLHDENMNVVAKAKFAQPIMKRESTKLLVKVAFDW